MHACAYTHIHTYIHAYIHAYIHTYIDTHAYIHAHTHTYIHAQIYMYIYIYIAPGGGGLNDLKPKAVCEAELLLKGPRGAAELVREEALRSRISTRRRLYVLREHFAETCH